MLGFKSIVVLLALYKAGPYLEAKISNLTKQSIFGECQFIILNCQNVDNEKSIYSDFVNSNENVIAIEYENYIGLYKSWNDGIICSQSEFICNSNVDDMWHPEYLAKSRDFLLNNPDIGCVSSYILYTEQPNQHDHHNWTNCHRYVTDTYPHHTAGPSPLWRRTLHDQFGLFGDYLTIGDADMWERWYEGGVKFAFIPEDLVLYYAYQDSLERRIDPNTLVSFHDIDQKKRLNTRRKND